MESASVEITSQASWTYLVRRPSVGKTQGENVVDTVAIYGQVLARVCGYGWSGGLDPSGGRMRSSLVSHCRAKGEVGQTCVAIESEQ